MIRNTGSVMNTDIELDILYHLLIALAIGLLIGIERGWQKRETEDGQRVAGIRTYGLIGLFAGVLTILSEEFSVLILSVGFFSLALIMGVMVHLKHQQSGEWGITSIVAAFLTFSLSSLAVAGYVVTASTAAIITVLLLNYKLTIHQWLQHLHENELKAGIQLLLISVVLLPVLPNEGFGPWQALNPYKIWLMVVLIATISFIGYFAMKIGGPKKGILFTGLFGGLVSSTAVTLHLSKLSKTNAAMTPIIASAILIACGTMFIRVMIIVSIFDFSLLNYIWLPFCLMAAITYLPILFYSRIKHEPSISAHSILKNPLELKTAISFGLILTIVMLLGVFLKQTFGDAGLITLSTISGIADVDAILLSLLEMSEHGLSTNTFVLCCVIAASMNNGLKSFLTISIGNRKLAFLVATPLVLGMSVGLGTALLS
jgi:uncharacterized membrane protein (DUF4010 family)